MTLNNLLKAGCLVCYALALAGLAGLLPEGISDAVQTIAAALLIIHALELLFVFRHVRRYPGALALSILLTLLFGLMHWMPLARRHARTSDGG